MFHFYFVSFCLGDEGETKSNARKCLNSYGSLAFHNLKHIDTQKLFAEIIMNGKKLVEHDEGNEKHREAKKKVVKALNELKKDKKALHYMEIMANYCDTKDIHLLEKLQNEEVEELEKETNAKQNNALKHS